METPDILIIGGGLIGCSLARELARAGRRVVVVDRGPNGIASTAAAGLLTPGLSDSPVGPLEELCHRSAFLYESWVTELRSEGAADVGFRRQGLLEVWTDPSLMNQQRRRLVEQARAERPYQLLSGEEVRRREPALDAAVLGGVYYPDDAQVDPARLTREVARIAEAAGAVLRENEPVYQLAWDRTRVKTVQTARTTYEPGCVVLTAGAWSGGLLQAVGLALPVRPVKGQMVLADCRASPVSVPVSCGDALLVPRPDGSLLLGVTLENVGFDDRVTIDGVCRILEGVRRLVPAVGALALARCWAGLRPASPDGLPFMGQLPPLKNLWVCTGHYRKGILLAPICARLMARSILDDRLDEALVPFKPTRRAP
jgi:glycine oxidase